MSTDSLSVLVVDDDYHVAEVHAGFVERVEGFRVVGLAHTAADALDMARRLHPDLVLMDIYLPDGDGLDVVRSLLGTDAPPAAIVISASRDVASVRTALQLGAVHYLVKPFGFTALAERLEAFRKAHTFFSTMPGEATQDDVNRIFGAARAVSASEPAPVAPRPHFAPTVRRVYETVSAQPGAAAAEIANAVGISRATAQRYLAQLEQSGLVTFELRYGAAGRPEHRYRITERR